MPIEIYLNEEKIGNLGPSRGDVVLKTNTHITWSGDDYNNVVIDSEKSGRRMITLADVGSRGIVQINEYVDFGNLFALIGKEPVVLHSLKIVRTNEV